MERHEKHKQTVEKRQRTDQEKLLDELRKAPIVTVAARRAGISPATVYRWKQESIDFARKVDAAIEDGKNLVSDMAESKLVEKIGEGVLAAARYWLDRHRDPFKSTPRYGGKPPPTARSWAEVVADLEKEDAP